MDDKSKKIAMTALKLGSGYHAVTNTVSGVKNSIGRIKSLFNLPSSNAVIVRRKDMPYNVFSPYLYQYGENKDVNGVLVFVPEGEVRNKSDIPEGKIFFKGAYFYGDNFEQLIDDTFTKEEQAEMIRGSEIKRVLMLTGASSVFIVILMFAIAGHIFSLFSLPFVFLLLIYSIKNAIYADILINKKIIGLKDYFMKRGFLRGIFA